MTPYSLHQWTTIKRCFQKPGHPFMNPVRWHVQHMVHCCAQHLKHTVVRIQSRHLMRAAMSNKAWKHLKLWLQTTICCSTLSMMQKLVVSITLIWWSSMICMFVHTCRQPWLDKNKDLKEVSSLQRFTHPILSALRADLAELARSQAFKPIIVDNDIIYVKPQKSRVVSSWCQALEAGSSWVSSGKTWQSFVKSGSCLVCCVSTIPESYGSWSGQSYCDVGNIRCRW